MKNNMEKLGGALFERIKTSYIKKNYNSQVCNTKVIKVHISRFGIDLVSMLLTLVVFSYVFYHNLYFALIGIPFFPFYYKSKCKKRIDKNRRLLRVAFKDTIQIINGFLQSGYSLENSMRKASEEIKVLLYANEAMVRYMEFMIMQMDLGCSVEEVWDKFANKSNVDEIKDFADVLRIVKRSGGEVSRIIQSSVYRIALQIQTEEDIEIMIQGKRIELKIMNVMPILILVYIGLSVPEMMAVMYETIVGKVIMTICLFIYLIGYWLGNKILTMEL